LVPPTIEERNWLRELIAQFVDGSGLVPPVSREQLTALSFQLIDKQGLDSGLWGWLMVEINNRLWRETFAAIPYGRRILLLPKCMSNSSVCTAEIDELGLLCRKCGNCSIATLEDKAEKLGVMSMVAEGFTPVTGLLESGAVDAVIGVGCLESLEKVFPLLVDNAVPGMAIALNCAGCKDTNVDTEYVEQISGNILVETGRAPSLQTEINQWFSADSVHLPCDSSDLTAVIAREWLGGEGKRWRPYLLVSVYMAITGDEKVPEKVKLAAIAVEAFHKASLIHDDIQDDDHFRYGKPTVYSAHGIPIAINVGDRLLGEGYRLLATCGNMALVEEAATAHLALCHGQGLELEWSRNRRPLTMDEVIHIFENKTVPAFSVALSFAVICAGDDAALKAILEKYAYALGIAYQLLDDLADFQSDSPVQLRPTSVLAAICEECQDKDLVDKLLLQDDISDLKHTHQPLFEQAITRVTTLAETYKQQALDSLSPLKNVEVNRLMFRITKKVWK
jgi:geranylgeranyl pyrophosphate synthase